MMPPDLTPAELRSVALRIREAIEDPEAVNFDQLERAAGVLDVLAAEMEGGAR